MSSSASTAPEGEEAVRLSADRARAVEPHLSDPLFAAVRRAVVGRPAVVHSPQGEPAYWLVPFVLGEHAPGFARVELDSRVSQMAVFRSAEDSRSWPHYTFFHAPPAQFVEEIERLHPNIRVADALFTYDGSPFRWGWRISLDTSEYDAFITPRGWRIRRHNADADLASRE